MRPVTWPAMWRRLHPAALIVRVASNAKGTVSLLLSFIVIIRVSLMRHEWWLWLAAAAIVVYVAVGPVCAWMSTRYRLSATMLEYRSGVLFRKRRAIAYGSIHAINSASPWYLRPFGVIHLTVSPVGDGADIDLSAVPSALQSELERRRAEAAGAARSGTSTPQAAADAPSGVATDGVAITAADAPTGTATDPTAPRAGIVTSCPSPIPIFRASTRDILLFAVTDPRMVAAAFVVYGFVQNLQDVLPHGLTHAAERSIGDYAAHGVPSIVLLAMACVILLMLVSIAISLLHFHGFEVWRRGDDLIVERGLFTRRATTIPTGRVQTIVVSQSLPRRVFGLCSTRLGLSAAASGDDVASAAVVLPVIGARRVAATLRAMLPEWGIPDMFAATAPTHRTGRGLTRYYVMMPLAATAAATLLVGVGGPATRSWPWWVMAAPLAAGLWWTTCRWLQARAEGYAMLPDGPEPPAWDRPSRSPDTAVPDDPIAEVLAPLPHRILVTGATRWGLFAMMTRRARVQSVTRTTTPWRDARGVEGLRMRLFVMNGMSEIRFRFLRRADADALEAWFTGR
ncbi:bacterial membrane flanked domain superfamily [Bifidobacterium stellenboschense]|uniref:Bacterial membrane flanked domain superfamily n=1 Tax=Bifidobacterium stellenboschense TaxID=762211 RepID=A0A087DRB5_9BIFI|nr:bacterial membrane flanked domain superfamily [Bifidobacterium stellenboschense]